MTMREVVRLLMLSPFYFRLSLGQRLDLLKEFCSTHQNSIAFIAPEINP